MPDNPVTVEAVPTKARERWPEAEMRFTAGQVAKVTGVPYGQINYWDRSGFISPSVQKAAGSATCRVYSANDVVAVAAAWFGRKLGMSLSGLAPMVGFIRRHRTLPDSYSQNCGPMMFHVSLMELQIAIAIASKDLAEPKRGKARLALGLPRPTHAP